ncbi:MAG: hypothetical protein R3A80_04965 [Bdellovibrionota bacterium]
MASSLDFETHIQNVLPTSILIKYRIVPMAIRDRKLCLIARRPLSNDALLELKKITGIEDYELQLVGDDVLEEYITLFIGGQLFAQPA